MEMGFDEICVLQAIGEMRLAISVGWSEGKKGICWTGPVLAVLHRVGMESFLGMLLDIMCQAQPESRSSHVLWGILSSHEQSSFISCRVLGC